MNVALPLILASSSPRRSDLLRELGVDFEVQTSPADEIQPEHLSPQEICQINAHRKADAVAQRNPHAWVLGADTLVFLDHQIFGKPKDLSQAHDMLTALQGKVHHVITGVCLLNLAQRKRKVFSDTTSVRFRSLKDADIDAYHALIQPLDKAGAYAIQDHGDRIVESIVGSHSNVVGLPLERLKLAFDELGIPPN
ncbi:MAG: septum formation protein Maf [Verrucomicrobiales bacterium]|nr:septum formation protein Maf [Verrucomicrobiales bacterium]